MQQSPPVAHLHHMQYMKCLLNKQQLKAPLAAIELFNQFISGNIHPELDHMLKSLSEELQDCKPGGTQQNKGDNSTICLLLTVPL